MKSPILLIFVFAITYCFNICDGADNDARGQIRTLMNTVKGQVNILKSSNSIIPNNIATQLQENMEEIKNSAVSQMQVHAQHLRMVEDNPCMSAAKDSLNEVATDLLQQFDNYTKSVKPKKSDSRKDVIVDGEYLILKCKKFLLNEKRKPSHATINKDFLKFKDNYIKEKIAIDSETAVDFSKINNCAKELKQQLRERVQSIVRLAKQCMNSL